MRIADYHPDHLPELTDVYNTLTEPVPHCFPVEVEELSEVFCRSGRAGSGEGPCEAEMVYVAGDPRILGFIHAAVGRVGEKDESKTIGVIRFLAYPRGRRDAGQALLERAEDWLRERGVRSVITFSGAFRYPFYGFLHSYISNHFEHIQALLLFNGYRVSEGEIFSDWLDFEPSPPREETGFKFELGVEKTPSRGPLPDIHLKARREGEQIGECILVSASAFTRRSDVDDWIFCKWLGVSDAFQGKKLGHYLLTQGLIEAQKLGYRNAAISNALDNHRALLFYSNFGFRAVEWTRQFARDLFEEK